MDAPKAPPAPPNPMAALFKGVADDAQKAAQAASEKRHQELMQILGEIKGLLKETLGG
jgi:hypothetical protein